ncbi:hypothetical protein AB4160_10005 [Shewanella sp. 10N.286.51.B8]|uniref:hypothetical protein n=1 Tax=Shewanella sp. 10N.286.51.B8 TaxID=3229708 RepID=UPI003550CDE9
MYPNKLTLILIAAISSTAWSAGAYAVSQTDFTNGVQTAANSGTSLADYTLTQMKSSPSEQTNILAFALQATFGKTATILEVLSAAQTAGMNADDALAIAIANGIDPSIVAEVFEETLTASGGTFGAAPAPGAQGFGGGSGGGGVTASSN